MVIPPESTSLTIMTVVLLVVLTPGNSPLIQRGPGSDRRPATRCLNRSPVKGASLIAQPLTTRRSRLEQLVRAHPQHGSVRLACEVHVERDMGCHVRRPFRPIAARQYSLPMSTSWPAVLPPAPSQRNAVIPATQ